MPRRYASMSLDGNRSALAASRPGAPLAVDSARSTGGNGSSGPSQGTMRQLSLWSAVAQRAEDVARVQTVVARRAVGEEEAQGLRDGGERDVVPGNFVLFEEAHFEALFACFDIEIEQSREVEQMHLMHVRNVQQRVQVLYFDARTGFFQCFARGGLRRRLAHFHEACGQSPVAVARFDRAPAQQHLVIPDGNGADHVARILIVHGAAARADEAFTVVAGRNAQAHCVAADGTEFHRKRMGNGDGSVSPGSGVTMTEADDVSAACA